MQERRTTVRCPCPGNAQYCAEDGGSPRDGRIVDVSERGLGVLLRESHNIGERLTVSFTLPGENQSITTTGTVCWSHEAPNRRRWHAVGLEWLPLQETDRFRVDTFLRERAPAPSSTGRQSLSPSRKNVPSIPWEAVGILGLISACVLLLLSVILQLENSQLGDMVHRRNALITRMDQDSSRIGQALLRTRGELDGTMVTVSVLEDKSDRLEDRLHMLSEELERYQSAYANLREERESVQKESRAPEETSVAVVLGPEPLDKAEVLYEENSILSGL